MSVPPWAAEREVDQARAAVLIGRSFPELLRAPVSALSQGWDNTVFHVGEGSDAWAFRFPRRAIAVPGVRREIAVLPGIAPRLPLPVPTPELVGVDDHPTDPWPFSGARFVTGRELADSRLPDAERVSAAAALGAFLRALHDPDLAQSVLTQRGEVGLPVDPMDRAWPRARSAGVRANLDQLVADGVWGGDPRVTELLRDADRLDAPSGAGVLVHGDLHVRHLLVDDTGEATGVIDWGDLALGDPAIDLSIAYAGFGGAARDALLSTYGGIDAEREVRARALAVRLSGVLAGYAAGDRRAGLLAEALTGLRRAVT